MFFNCSNICCFSLLSKSNKKAPIKTKALGNIKSEGLKNVMDDFFND